jgi:hypothetical protein
MHHANGQTTLLRNLSRELTAEGRYAALTVSLESFTDPDVPRIMPQILKELRYCALQQLPERYVPPSPEAFAETPHIALKAYPSAWNAGVDRPLVVFFDEIDAIPGTVLISGLRQLGAGYTSRPAPFPQRMALVAVREGMRVIANPIYQEIIPRVLTHRVQTAIPDRPAWFVAADGTLGLRKLVDGFIEFWRRHGEVLLRGMPYHEAAPHLTFMAYLQLITNAGGRIEREFAIGTGRADLVVEYGGRADAVELKILRGRHTLPDGVAQVTRYAKRLGRDVGYLVIFDLKSETPFEDRGQVEELQQDGVTVVLVRV